MSLLKDRWKLYKLRRQEKKLDEEVERRLVEAKEKNEVDKFREWYNSAYVAYEVIRLSRNRIVSEALMQEADDLHLPRPPADRSKWEFGEQSGMALTPEAMTDIRSAIRKEKRERRETVEWWVKLLGGLIGILTGLVGALIGLVSVWKHK